MDPLVSVIIPVYNGQEYLNEAIQSVLRQEYKPIEIIVVDDGSTDNTKEIGDKYDIVTYIYQTNQGPSAARNTGLECARGILIAFIDSDDIWSDDKLKIQFTILNDNPSVDVVLGYLQYFRMVTNEDGNVVVETILKPSRTKCGKRLDTKISF